MCRNIMVNKQHLCNAFFSTSNPKIFFIKGLSFNTFTSKVSASLRWYHRPTPLLAHHYLRRHFSRGRVTSSVEDAFGTVPPPSPQQNTANKCAAANPKLSCSGEEEDKPIQNVAILLSRDKATPLWRSTPSSSRNQVHYGLLGSGVLYLSVHYGWSHNCLLETVIQGRGTSMADYKACLATEDWWPTAQMTTKGLFGAFEHTAEGQSLWLFAQFTSAAAKAAGDESHWSPSTGKQRLPWWALRQLQGGPLMTRPDVWPTSKTGETMEETHLSSVAVHSGDLHSALISFLPVLIHL